MTGHNEISDVVIFVELNLMLDAVFVKTFDESLRSSQATEPLAL